MSLPLFQGLCSNELTLMLEKMKLHFHKVRPKGIIVHQGEECNKLILLLCGSINSETTDKEQTFSLTEKINSPAIIEPYSLFGLQPQYTATYRAETEVSLLYINKVYLLTEMMKYTSFQINYLNLLSARSQCYNQKIWEYKNLNITQKIYNFVYLRCAIPQGEKKLSIRMEDLGTLIGETRVNVSKELNDLCQKGLVKLTRKNILIPDLEKLK